jgi:hypothetical protein
MPGVVTTIWRYWAVKMTDRRVSGKLSIGVSRAAMNAKIPVISKGPTGCLERSIESVHSARIQKENRASTASAHDLIRRRP